MTKAGSVHLSCYQLSASTQRKARQHSNLGPSSSLWSFSARLFVKAKSHGESNLWWPVCTTGRFPYGWARHRDAKTACRQARQARDYCLELASSSLS